VKLGIPNIYKAIILLYSKRCVAVAKKY